MQEIIDIISNLGFPIAMVVYFIYDKKQTMDNVITAINNNSIILNRLLEKLDHIGLPIEEGVIDGK